MGGVAGVAKSWTRLSDFIFFSSVTCLGGSFMFCFTVSLGQPLAFLTAVLCSHPHGKNPIGCRETATPWVPWRVAAQSLGVHSLLGSGTLSGVGRMGSRKRWAVAAPG